MGKAIVVAGDGSRSTSRRRWSVELKRRIVEESFAPGASVSLVARAYDVNANQVFSWRRRYQQRLLGRPGSAATLLPVRVIGEDAKVPVVRLDTKPIRTGETGTMQVEMAHGRLQVEGTPDPIALRIVLECLRG
jgi:transposase